MPRSAAEINAEAQRLDQEAQDIVARAQARLGVAQQTTASAQTSAQEARTSAADALRETAAGNVIGAESHCTAATAHLAAAVTYATQAFAGVAGGDPKEEWKECRQSIDRFDKLLVDLRKTGFGFITTIVGASALFIGTTNTPPSEELQFGVFAIIGFLIIMLFAVDCTHQVWLKTAVSRAIDLETQRLNYTITTNIRNKFKGWEAGIIGVGLYALLLATTSAIFLVAAHASGHTDYRWWIVGSSVVAGAWIVGFGWYENSR
jgi:multidrug efflux pump subunit AcrA (membrane-fusion protein)